MSENTSTKNKVVGKYVTETTDWGAYDLSLFINEIQSKHEEKLVLTGDSFEHEGSEYQIIVFSTETLTEKELRQAKKEAMKEL